MYSYLDFWQSGRLIFWKRCSIQNTCQCWIKIKQTVNIWICKTVRVISRTEQTKLEPESRVLRSGWGCSTLQGICSFSKLKTWFFTVIEMETSFEFRLECRMEQLFHHSSRIPERLCSKWNRRLEIIYLWQTKMLRTFSCFELIAD